MQGIHYPSCARIPLLGALSAVQGALDTSPEPFQFDGIFSDTSQFRNLMLARGWIDNCGLITDPDLQSFNLPSLNENQILRLHNLFFKSFRVQGRAWTNHGKYPLHLKLSLENLLKPYLSHEIYLVGTALWKTLGIDYFGQIFEQAFSNKFQGRESQLKQLMTPTLREKTHRKSDVDLIIFIQEPSEIQPFLDILCQAYDQDYNRNAVIHYLNTKSINTLDKEGYVYQTLEKWNSSEKSDFSNLSDQQIIQLLIELNGFSSAINIKDSRNEFYYRSLTDDQGQTYDFTFIISSNCYAYDFQALKLSINPLFSTNRFTPTSFCQYPLQAILDTNSGIIRLPNLAQTSPLSEREINIYCMALVYGLDIIEKHTESSLKNSIVQAVFPKDVLSDLNDEAFVASLHARTFKLSEKNAQEPLVLCLFFNTLYTLKTFGLSSDELCENLKNRFLKKVLIELHEYPFLKKIIEMLAFSTFKKVNAMMDLLFYFWISHKASLTLYRLKLDQSPLGLNYCLGIHSKEPSEAQLFLKIPFDLEGSLDLLLQFDHLELSAVLELFKQYISPLFQLGDGLNEKCPDDFKERILRALQDFVNKIDRNNGLQRELMIYIMLSLLSIQPDTQQFEALLALLLDETLLAIPKERRHHVCKCIYKFFVFLPEKNSKALYRLLEAYCVENIEALPKCKIQFWSQLPASIPLLEHLELNRTALYKIFSNNLSNDLREICLRCIQTFNENERLRFGQMLCYQEAPDMFSFKLLWLAKALNRQSRHFDLLLKDFFTFIESYALEPIDRRYLDELKHEVIELLENLDLVHFPAENHQLASFLIQRKIITVQDLQVDHQNHYYRQQSALTLEKISHESNLSLLISKIHDLFSVQNHSLNSYEMKTQVLGRLIDHFYLKSEELSEASISKLQFIFDQLPSSFQERYQEILDILLSKFESQGFFHPAATPPFVEIILKLALKANVLRLNPLLIKLHAYLSHSQFSVEIKHAQSLFSPNLFQHAQFQEHLLLYHFLIKTKTLRTLDVPHFCLCLAQYLKREQLNFCILKDLLVEFEKIPANLILIHFINLPNIYLTIANIGWKEQDWKIAIKYYQRYLLSEVDIDPLYFLKKALDLLDEKPHLAIDLVKTIRIKAYSREVEKSFSEMLNRLLQFNHFEDVIALSIQNTHLIAKSLILLKIEVYLSRKTQNILLTQPQFNLILEYFCCFPLFDLKIIPYLLQQVELFKVDDLKQKFLEIILKNSQQFLSYDKPLWLKCWSACFKELNSHEIDSWATLFEKTRITSLLTQVFQQDAFYYAKILQVILPALKQFAHFPPASSQPFIASWSNLPIIHSSISGVDQNFPLSRIIVEALIKEQQAIMFLWADILLTSSHPQDFLRGVEILNNTEVLGMDLKEKRAFIQSQTLFIQNLSRFIKNFSKSDSPLTNSHLAIITGSLFFALDCKEISVSDWHNLLLSFSKISTDNLNKAYLYLIFEKLIFQALHISKHARISKDVKKAFAIILQYLKKENIFCEHCLNKTDKKKWLLKPLKPLLVHPPHKEDRVIYSFLSSTNKMDLVVKKWVDLMHQGSVDQRHILGLHLRTVFVKAIAILGLASMSYVYNILKKGDSN